MLSTKCNPTGIERDLQRRPIYECRCDERLKSEDEGSTRPVPHATQFIHWVADWVARGTGHPKIETRLIDESYEHRFVYYESTKREEI
jgi:hypothetical protein